MAKMSKQKIFVDMDGVIAEWNHASMEELTTPGYFLARKAQENIIRALKQLQDQGYELYICSSYLYDYSRAEKNHWCDINIPFIDYEHRVFVPYGGDKSQFVPNGIQPDDVLIDDFWPNLHKWSEHGIGIKFLNGVNSVSEHWHGYMISHLMTTDVMVNTIDGICQTVRA